MIRAAFAFCGEPCLVEENRRNLPVIVYTLDNLGEDVGTTQNRELVQILLLIERNGF